MRLQKGRIASWFPITLAVTGSFALLVGVFVAVLSIPEIVTAGHPGSNLPLQGALYVGTNTCFTCHGDQPLDWSVTLYTQIVVNPSEKPQAVSNLEQGDQVQQIDTNDIVDAYTTAGAGQSSNNSFHQYYVVKTEDGHILLPKQRNIGDVGTDGVRSEDSMIKCSTCHAKDLGSKLLGYERISLTLGTQPYPVMTTALITTRHRIFGVSAMYKSSVHKALF